MGTASEQSLRNILTELESDTLPTGAATAANQTTMITALQLIDDLRNALASVATDKLRASIIDSALPTDAATQITLASCLTQLQSLLTELQLKADLTETQPVSAASLPLPSSAATSANQSTEITALQLIDDLRNALGSVNTDDLQVDVKTMPTTTIQAAGGDKPFSLESALWQSVNHVCTQNNDAVVGTSVPTGKMWVISLIAARDETTALTYVQYYAHIGSAYHIFYDPRHAVAAWQHDTWTGTLYLNAGDSLYAVYFGSLTGDTIVLTFHGYQMDAPS
jgi:hypothetical protein